MNIQAYSITAESGRTVVYIRAHHMTIKKIRREIFETLINSVYSAFKYCDFEKLSLYPGWYKLSGPTDCVSVVSPFFGAVDFDPYVDFNRLPDGLDPEIDPGTGADHVCTICGLESLMADGMITRPNGKRVCFFCRAHHPDPSDPKSAGPQWPKAAINNEWPYNRHAASPPVKEHTRVRDGYRVS